MIRRHLSESAGRTFDLGCTIGRRARRGLVIALEGQLGAGKTLFTRGLHQGLGLPDEGWSGSPTFVLATRYPGSPGLLHADFYRLASSGEVGDLGLDDALAEGAVVVVEWADRLPDALPGDRLRVRFTVVDEHRRELLFDAVGEVAEALLDEVLPAREPSEEGSESGSRAASASGSVTSEGARWP